MRKVWLVSLFAAALAAGCGGTASSPTSPSAALSPSGAHVTGGATVVNDTHGTEPQPEPEPEPEPEPKPEPAPAPTPAPTPTPAPQPQEVELSGTVSSVSGTAASFQFMVNGMLVKGDGTTTFTAEETAMPSFSMLTNGAAVEVKGTQQSGFVQAARIQIDNQPEDNNNEGAEVELQGTLGTIAGTCPAITSTVAGTSFVTSASTRFDDSSCASLKSGDRVEVKGTKQSNGTVAATRVTREDS